jgi:hypothetical protein
MLAEVRTEQQPQEARTFTRRIGSTTYRVGVHFNGNSRETMNDKILRLIQNEAACGKAAGL